MPDSLQTQAGGPADLDTALAFFGRVTAGATHELNNVFSIIEQVTGLIEDQLAAACSGEPLDPDRLAAIPVRVERQIERAVVLLQHLNRFAHSVDQGGPSADLNETVETIAVLLQRFASRAEVHLAYERTPLILLLEGSSAFTVMQVVFELCCALFEHSGRGDKLVLRVNSEPESGRLDIQSDAWAHLDDDDSRLRRARTAAVQLGGELRVDRPCRQASLLLPAVTVTNID